MIIHITQENYKSFFYVLTIYIMYSIIYIMINTYISQAQPTITPAIPAENSAVNYAAAFQSFIYEIDVKAKTKKAYAKAFMNFMKFNAVNTGLAGRPLMLAYKENLKTRYKPATTNLYLSGVKSFFAYCGNAGICHDIAKGIKSVKDTREYKKDELRKAEIKAIFSTIDRKTIKGKRDFALLSVLLFTGIRTISAALADVSDVDFTRKSIIYQGKGQEDKTAVADLPEICLNAIKEYHAAAGITQGALFQSLGRVKQTDPSRRLPTETISGIVKAAFRAAGINSERLSAHSLRHTFATTLHRAGVNIESIAAKLGHSSTETTKKYVHLAAQNDLKAGQIVASFLGI